MRTRGINVNLLLSSSSGVRTTKASASHLILFTLSSFTFGACRSPSLRPLILFFLVFHSLVISSRPVLSTFILRLPVLSLALRFRPSPETSPHFFLLHFPSLYVPSWYLFTNQRVPTVAIAPALQPGVPVYCSSLLIFSSYSTGSFLAWLLPLSLLYYCQHTTTVFGLPA